MEPRSAGEQPSKRRIPLTVNLVAVPRTRPGLLDRQAIFVLREHGELQAGGAEGPGYDVTGDRSTSGTARTGPQGSRRVDHLASKHATRIARADSRRACVSLAGGELPRGSLSIPFGSTDSRTADTRLDRAYGRDPRRPHRWRHRADRTRSRVEASFAKSRQGDARSRGKLSVLF